MTSTIATHQMSGAEVVIRPDGALTAQNALQVRERVIAVLSASKPSAILVDLGAVASIDDAGLTVLVSGFFAAAACDVRLAVVDPQPQVLDQLRTRGLGSLLATPAATRGHVEARRASAGLRQLSQD